MLRYILIKQLKIKYKEETLKAAKKKQQISSTRKPEWIFWPTQYKVISVRLSADFSAETLQARREGHIISDKRGKTYT